MRNLENFDKSTIKNKNVTDINEAELEFKKDYQVGEGATYTGQMKLVMDASTK